VDFAKGKRRKGVNPIPLNPAGNFNRIPPVLAKPKPPPFNKMGLTKNEHGISDAVLILFYPHAHALF